LLKNSKKIKINKIEKKKHGVITLYDKTKKLAEEEGKIPVICLCQSHRKGFWIIVHEDDLDKVNDIREQDNSK
tara:strand:- start:883 stop:1101 length:219 start_codon:yes stop_codon:yes gene_type:complete